MKDNNSYANAFSLDGRMPLKQAVPRSPFVTATWRSRVW